jgi:hypothetical protein
VIEKLKESGKRAFGFKVTGKLTANDIDSISEQLDFTLAEQKQPIGLLTDLTEMEGASWAARWEEMRFLQHHSSRIARLAIISNDEWQEVGEMMVVATAALQSETLYFHSAEIHHAWHWVKMNKLDTTMPVRLIQPGKGLFSDYTPEYVGI